MHNFPPYFGKEHYMFQKDLQSIIRGLNTVFTAIGICHTSYWLSASRVRMELSSILTSLADSQHN